MASVAADTSAIAPPLPLPSRSDAAPPAGPSGAFADLLNAQAAPAPQGAGPPSPPSPGTQDGSIPASPGAGSLAGNSAAAGTTGPKASKDASSGKDPKDDDTTATDNSGNSGRGADPTLVVGLALLPLPIASIAVAADVNPPASSNAPSSSADPIGAVNADGSGKSSDPNAASLPPRSNATALAALIPGTPPSVDVPAPSPVAPNATDGSLPATRQISAPATAIASALTSSVSLDSPPALTVPGQQPDGTPLPNPPVTAPTPDGVLGSAPPAELQNLVAPALPATDGAIGMPDQSAKSNPPPGIVAAVNAGNPSSFAGVAPINPLPLATGAASAVAGGEQTPATPETTHESDPPFIVLPAQVAARFATSIRATDAGASDVSSDASTASAANNDDATKAGNDQPGATQPNFNPAVLTPLQAPPVTAPPPPHAALTTDAVPLAGIPIAIAARVEAGERHFDIRLDPPDLGRIEVQLSVDSSGRATSHLVVDRADTLDLLRRDAPALERALHSAGLTTDDGALQFSLRDQSFAGRDQGMPAPPPPPAGPTSAESDLAPIDAAVRRYGPPTGLGSGIDIRV